jgi:hypothetical protein
MPIDRDATLWSCGQGFRCAEDFKTCTPAVGSPLRRRD